MPVSRPPGPLPLRGLCSATPGPPRSRRWGLSKLPSPSEENSLPGAEVALPFQPCPLDWLMSAGGVFTHQRPSAPWALIPS